MSWTLRCERHTGDLAWLLGAHAGLAREMGWDATFEAYVATPMAACMLAASQHERIWIAEGEGRACGSVAIVESDVAHDASIKGFRIGEHPGPVVPDLRQAQLRWFLVVPEARGQGLGKVLLERAVTFSRGAGYDRIILWTVSRLEPAAHLYRSVGFEKVHELPAKRWGAEVVEEQYALWLGPRRWE